ncbi:asparaginase [Arthrobacter wenxiniae]|uniref:Asparaginase n=1 Tax=Arthrobacter wenxiniae TaxID=2713570 RepID=A0A7Y7IDM5_9MICC|nr:asparaginase [Arthrobacter wenxiniae]NVM93572.1 asparaginase [Arthrobacter wenxiniae]
MIQTFRAHDAVELAVLERSGFVESRHVGSAVVVAADGSVVTSLGAIDSPIFPRSAVKPFQALAAMQSGVPLRGPQVAIAAGSHAGSLEHMDVVDGMLKAAGLSENHLRCPAAWPADPEARAWRVRTDRGKSRIAMNCSGKHAAFLWACTENGWDTAGYLEPNHPMQRAVRRVLEEYTGQPVRHTGIDGCGAPVMSVTLKGLARAFSTLAKAPSDTSANARAATVATSMLDYPWAVEGHGRPNTVVMEELGVLAKLGAEGVLAMAAPSGASVAVKMLDGNGRAATLVALTLLAACGALDVPAVAAVLAKVVPPIMGGTHPAGSLRLGNAVSALLD